MRWLDSIIDSMEEFEQTPRDGEGQGGLVCYSPQGRKESDTTEWPNSNNNPEPMSVAAPQTPVSWG